jgi:hypothetical protein
VAKYLKEKDGERILCTLLQAENSIRFLNKFHGYLGGRHFLADPLPFSFHLPIRLSTIRTRRFLASSELCGQIKRPLIFNVWVPAFTSSANEATTKHKTKIFAISDNAAVTIGLN